MRLHRTPSGVNLAKVHIRDHRNALVDGVDLVMIRPEKASYLPPRGCRRYVTSKHIRQLYNHLSENGASVLSAIENGILILNTIPIPT